MSDSVDELVKKHPRVFLLVDIGLYTLFTTVITVMLCVMVVAVKIAFGLF